MAGRIHHHVPQFLQRGFGTLKGKSVQVCVYRSEGDRFSTNTRNFGAERDFYSQEDDSLVDDLITKYEGDIAGLIGSLREGQNDALERVDEISNLIGHLEIRTKALRNNISELSGALFSLMLEWFGNPETLERMVIAHLKKDPSIILKEISKHTRDRNEIARIRARIRPQMGGLIAQHAPLLAQGLTLAFAQNQDRFKSMPRNTHLEVLRENVVPAGRVRAYRRFRFSLLRFDDQILPLGDTMVSFQTSAGFRPMANSLADVSAILLPVGSHVALWGTRSGGETLSYKDALGAIAATSFESFIACEENETLNAARVMIGKSAKLIPNSEMERLFGDLFNELLGS